MFSDLEVKMAKILLITNETMGEGEDIFLASLLQGDFGVKIYDVSQDIPSDCANFDIFLFRNAWPERIYDRKIKRLVNIAIKNNIIIYNSLQQRSKSFSLKSYLYYLNDNFNNVIPTYKTLAEFPENKPILIKPQNGGSSYGVKIFANKNEIHRKLNNYIIQEYIPFVKEQSYFFIDKKFCYALETIAPGMDNRWELREFVPTRKMLRIAKSFMKWNDMPYGIDRIDFGVTSEGLMLLMEIESDRSYLSLEELSQNTLDNFINSLKHSLKKVLASAKTHP